MLSIGYLQIHYFYTAEPITIKHATLEQMSLKATGLTCYLLNLRIHSLSLTQYKYIFINGQSKQKREYKSPCSIFLKVNFVLSHIMTLVNQYLLSFIYFHLNERSIKA